MKNLPILFVLIFLSLKSLACCEGFSFDFFPNGHKMSTNSIVLLNYSEDDFKIFEALEQSDFYLETETGQQFPLKVSFKAKGHNNFGQFLFRLKEELPLNSTVQFKIDNFQSNSRHKDWFLKEVDKAQWDVVYQKDTIQPLFTTFPRIQYAHSFNSTVPGHAGYGTVTYTDNIDYYNHDIEEPFFKEMIVKTTNEDGQVYFLPLVGKYFWIYDISCDGNFKLEFDKTYQYNIQLMDFSGNFSDDIHKIKFFTDRSAAEGKGF